MSDLAQIEIEHDVAEAAARRAAEEGVTVTAFISLLLRRSLERGPGEESVLVYDHVDDGGKFHIDREPDEDEESYRHRIVLYGDLFGCRGCYRKYSLKTLLISYLLSILMCCVVLDAAKAVLVCLHADELGSFPESREKELLRSYFTSQFGGRIKNIVQINNKFYLIPTSDADCKRCFYQLVAIIDDKVMDVTIFAGSGTIWVVPEDDYPYLGKTYTGFTIGAGEQARSDLHIQVPNIDGAVPIVEIFQRGEMKMPNCRMERR